MVVINVELDDAAALWDHRVVPTMWHSSLTLHYIAPMIPAHAEIVIC